MGVVYKLRQEVIDYILSQRQENPLASCRQLAESASEKFGLHLSKSSVHEVLKESGVVSSRGRKPKDRFQIPQEKKNQIQQSLAQVKLEPEDLPSLEISKISEPLGLGLIKDVAQIESAAPLSEPSKPVQADHREILSSPEYENAGAIFLKAALWDLGIFTDDPVAPRDWSYYSTYTKAIELTLENNQVVSIAMKLPIERALRELADGLTNNIRPFIVDQVSDKQAFEACMDQKSGYKIQKISIVDEEDHKIVEISDIVEFIRKFEYSNRIFVVSNEHLALDRAKVLFFSEDTENNDVMDNIAKLSGYDEKTAENLIITLLIPNTYTEIDVLNRAIEKLNNMYLYDSEARLLKLRTDLTGL